MTYNKKQMQPLIDKYGINPETNKLFIKVCEMFDGKPNYQIWAVKMIFSKSMTMEESGDWAKSLPSAIPGSPVFTKLTQQPCMASARALSSSV